MSNEIELKFHVATCRRGAAHTGATPELAREAASICDHTIDPLHTMDQISLDPQLWPTEPPTEPGLFFALVFGEKVPEVVRVEIDEDANGTPWVCERIGRDVAYWHSECSDWRWRPGRIVP